MKSIALRALGGTSLGVGGSLLVFSALVLSTFMCPYGSECVTLFHMPTIYAGVVLMVFGIVALIRSSPKSSQP